VVTTGSGTLSQSQYFERDEEEKGTNPYELTAAAHAACFSMTRGPTRTPESGPVERAGTNQEFWVDSHYPGTGPTAGDFGDPFRRLVDAMNAVAAGGTINIINAGIETTPGVYTKRMTLKAVPGPTTLVQ
jgi:hypothetical protein